MELIRFMARVHNENVQGKLRRHQESTLSSGVHVLASYQLLDHIFMLIM